MQPSRSPSLLALALICGLAACGPATVEEVLQQSEKLPMVEQEYLDREEGPSIQVQEPEVYEDGTTWNCTEQKYSLSRNLREFFIFDPTAEVIYPGSLLQGATLASGTPEPISVRRGGGTIVLNLLNSGGDTSAKSYQLSLDQVTLGNVVDAQNRILSNNVGKTPAAFDVQVERLDYADSKNRVLGAKLGWFFKLGGDRTSTKQTRHTRYMVRLVQRYYTMVFQEPAQSGQPLIHPSVTPAELAPFVGPGEPVTYLSSVTYGRQFLLLFESTSSAQDLGKAINFAFGLGDLDFGAESQSRYAKTQQQTTITVYALGGPADSALEAAISATEGKFDKLREYFVAGSNFDSSSPGMPISYTARYAQDSSIVHVGSTAEYTRRKCHPVVKQDGRLVLWLDAQSLQAQDQQYISTWPGRSFTSNDGRNGRALYFKSGINGRPSVWFQGATSTKPPHRFTVDLGTGYLANTDYTIFTVLRTAGTDLPAKPAPGNYFLQGIGTTEHTNLVAGWKDSSRFHYTHHSSALTANALPNAQGDVLTLRFSRKDGKWLYQNGIFRAAAVKQTTPLASFVGASLGHATSPFVGHIGEVRAYNYALSEAEQKTIECELGARWEIAVADCRDGKPDPSTVTF